MGSNWAEVQLFISANVELTAHEISSISSKRIGRNLSKISTAQDDDLAATEQLLTM